jgi:pimeloyl-ACP methyl ester carboxylesterase
MSQKPSFIFVPGAWHRPETWDKVISEIRSREYRCVAVELPSTTGDTSAGFGGDVKAVQDAIRGETAKGRDVVLVVHSYGGQVGNSAVKGFARRPHDGSSPPPPESASGRGHVIGLAMMATGFTVTGVGFLEATGGKPPPQWVADTQNGVATIVVDARDMLYHDLPEEEGKMWVERLTTQSLKALAEGGEHAYSGWRDVPCWYLLTAEDRALPPQVQRIFVEAAQAAGADVTLREIASSHSPMLSKPKETAEFILEAADDFVEKSEST